MVAVTLRAFVGTLLFSTPPRSAQQCPGNGLQSPPAILHGATRSNDTEWEAVPGVNNTWQHTLTFDAYEKQWEALNTKITTRLFSGHFPSQTLRFKRGNQYRVTLVNNLGPESVNNPTEMNVEKDINTTNIHTHGLHISGMGDSDNVFISVGPRENHTYRYNIPCNHAGGTFWWHPHHHGSTHIQVAGGAAGALIIEDDAEMEGLPSWYTEMEELIFYISHIHLSKYTTMLPDFDETWKYDKIDQSQRTAVVDTWWVNGQYQPTICMTAGEWIKFRFGQIETTEKSRTFYIGSGECTQYLLAKDGVMVHGLDDTDIPRQVGNGVFIAHSSRVDVAISCPGDASGSALYEIWHNLTSTTMSGVESHAKYVIAYIEVTGNATEPATELTSFTPIRPDYLENLMPGKYEGDWPQQEYLVCEDEYGYQHCETYDYLPDMEVSGATIDHQKFDGESNYFAFMDVHKIHVWEITNEGANIHPLHIHVNHFQMINSTLNANDPDGPYENWVDIPFGFQEEGDWMDTLWGPGYITFKTDVFGGSVSLHCHILIHEDQGAMGTAWINDGCDGDYNDVGESGSCTYRDTCEQFGPLEPTVSPTPSPTPEVSNTIISPGVPTAYPIATPAPVDEDSPSIVVLQLTTTRSLTDFEEDSVLYTNGDTSVYAYKVIEWALEDMEDGGNEEIEIGITLVERGSVKITYTLTSNYVEKLVEAVACMKTRVTNEDKFQYTEDALKYRLKEHLVLVSYTLVSEYFDMSDGWQWKEIILLAVCVAILCLCCGMIACCVRSFRKKKERHETIRNLAATGYDPYADDKGDDPKETEGTGHTQTGGQTRIEEKDLRDKTKGDGDDVIAAMEMIDLSEKENAVDLGALNQRTSTGHRSRSKSLGSRSHGGVNYLSPDKSRPDTMENTDSENEEEEDIIVYQTGGEDEPVELVEPVDLHYMQSISKDQATNQYL